MTSRHIVWYSNGVTSAALAYLVTRRIPDAEVVLCDTMSSEHPDNRRFLNDVEKWIGKKITVIRSDRFSDVNQVIEKIKFMSSINGAPCTNYLKRLPRKDFQLPDDTHHFGFSVEEATRAARFEHNNPSLTVEWDLIDAGITKNECLDWLSSAGIGLPAMYALGYEHNNCIGCVKSQSAGYWNKVRRDFPDVYAIRERQEQMTGAKLIRLSGGARCTLAELREYYPDNEDPQDDIDCGPLCVSPEERR
mgnify:CR=1 FL=1